MKNNDVKELLAFIDKGPTCFHVVEQLTRTLDSQGFSRLQETEDWDIEKGKKYYVTRNDSSLLAFSVPDEISGFHIMASHSDSPSFKIKENPEILVEKKYIKLNVEKYGGMLMSTWFDRPLSVAGRLLVRDDDKIRPCLVDVREAMAVIPNLAIHMNRKANEGYIYNPQKDLLPLIGCGAAEGHFISRIAEAAGVCEEDIVGQDLFLYPKTEGCIWGSEGEYMSSARLDDLGCVFSTFKGFLAAENCRRAAVLAVFDNEEVGSTTKQGAASDFMKSVLHRICRGRGMDEGDIYRVLASSFMVSADNAHSVHPNYGEKADSTNRPYMNEGIVIKYNANQKYTTDGVSAAVFKTICEKAGVPYQTFFNRSDMAGGSTLGNIANTQISVNTVDVGLAQLSMHSAYETGGTKDISYLKAVSEAFFKSSVEWTPDGAYRVKMDI